jgi:uncharacterized protein YbjQ (UPF0145 family)
MSEDARAELRRRLGPPANELVGKLSDADAQKLAELLAAARRHQADALVKAQEHALRFVPALLRKPLLKLFT